MSQPRYPNQQPGPFQPQWSGGGPSGGFSNPQQQGAWGGQWQQQPPPPPASHQQQGGFYAPQPPQGGFPHQQFPPTPQFVPASRPPLAPAQAFAHQQQLLAIQQQRQMAYVQEQQRLAREEQRKREFEIQKRRLQHISVINPAAANPLDDLFGKKLPSATVSPSQGTMPSGSSTPSSNSSTPPPPPSQLPIVTLGSEPPQGMHVPTPHTGTAETDLKKQKKEVQRPKPDTAETYKKLMTESLSNLSGPAPPTRKKMEFKTSTTTLKTSSHVEKSFTQSSKSRAWSANTDDFIGVFAVHQQPKQQQPQEGQQDDGFGEFLSSADNNFGEFHSSGQSSSTSSVEQSVFQAAPVFQQPLGVPPPPPQNPSSLGQGGFVLGQAGITPSQVPPLGLGTVTPTSSYTHPIAAASVSGPVSNTVTSNAPHHLQGVQFRAHSDSSASVSSDTTLNVAVPNLPPSDAPTKLDSSRFPPVYSEVYKQCYKPGDSFVRTDLLLPILTSSQLPQSVLRDLWTIANKSVPGKLTQTELYVLLGLIGLAQTGHPSPSMDALKSAPRPPVPRFSAFPEVTSLTTLGPPSTTPGPPSTIPGPPSITGQLQAAGDFGEFHSMAPPSSSLAQPTLPPAQTTSLQPALPPTQMPSLQPTLPPAQTTSTLTPPTQTPFLQPSLPPTQTPSLQPTLPPTQTPSTLTPPIQTPFLQPSLPPTQTPSLQSSLPPTQMPSRQPTLPPTQMPSRQPTLPPTQMPSLLPAPSVQQTAPYEPTANAVLLPVNLELPLPNGAPLVPEAATQAIDKYSAFEELRGIGSTSEGPETISIDSGVTVSAAVTQPSGEKYAAFDELRQLSNTNIGLETPVMPSLSSTEDAFGPFISIPPPLPSVTAIPQPPHQSDTAIPQPTLPSVTIIPQPPHPSDTDISQPSLPSVTTIPQPLLPVSTGAKPTDTRSVSPNIGGARVGGLSALTGYTSASTTSTLSTTQATSIPATTTMIGDSIISTADTLFASFGSDHQKHSTDNDSWADFSNFTTVQPVGLLANVATIPQLEAVPEVHVPHSQMTGGPESSAATVEVIPGEQGRKPRSQSIGLEILEEELEGDIETLQPPPPVDFSQPLVPETVTHVKGGDEDFGEFEAYGSSTAEQLPLKTREGERGFPTTVWKPPLKVDPVRILTTCLSKCEEVLEQSAGVFAEVKESSLLQEICEVEEGRNKLRGIVEVYRLAKRVFCSLMHMNQGAVNDRQVKNIQKHWKTLMSALPNNTMEKLYSQTAMAKEEEESDVLSDTISRCSICLLSKDVTVPSPLSLDTQREEYSLPLLFHHGQSYHPTCANFWYNAVREELPTQ